MMKIKNSSYRSVDLMSVKECILCRTIYHNYDVVNACSLSSFRLKIGAVNLDLYTW